MRICEEPVFIEVDDMQIVYHRPGGQIDTLLFSELQAVIVETNSFGPFATDVFWILVGKNGGCVIPAGIQGENALLGRLQQLSGFDNAMVIEAMSCMEEQRFLCWKRAEDDGEQWKVALKSPEQIASDSAH